MFKKNIIKLLIILNILFLHCSSFSQEEKDAIKDIRILGNQRLDYDTIQSYININIGDYFTSSSLNEAFKSLFSTDLFSSISFSKNKNTLVINVVENPVINRTAFEGNKRIDDEDIQTEIFLKPRIVFTRNKVKKDLQRLSALYRRSGRFAAKISPKVIMLDQNRVDLVFEIEEGPVTKISDINFIGNSAFTDSTLRREMLLSESRWWKVLSTSDRYDPDVLSFDQDNLRRFYINQGFVDVDIISTTAELRPEKDFFSITVSLEEGKRHKFGNIKGEIRITGIKGSLVRKSINIKKNQWYSAEKLDVDSAKITESIMASGYPFVEVVPKLTRRTEDGYIDVNFVIRDGPRAYVNRINIIGNSRTLDRVIRRNIRLSEGDAFNRSLMARSRTLINNLGHFSTVDIKEIDNGNSNTVDIEVNVTEQSTGDLSFGAGFSSGNGALANAGITERNLFGKGQRINANVTFSERTNRVDFSFMEPYFLSRNLSLTTDIFSTERFFTESKYDQDTDGGAIGIGYGLGEYTRQSIKYDLQQQVIKAYSDASTSIKSQAGTNLISKVGLGTSYDKTDNRFNPTDGFLVSNGINFAGIGGDKHYIQTTASIAKYKTFMEEKITFSLSSKAGYIIGIGEDIEVSDRFIIGNNTFSGFQTAGIGPRDKTNDSALGGNAYFTIKPELRFGIGLPKELQVQGRVFAMTGTLTQIDTLSSYSNYYDDSAIRLSAGAGISWNSPFGPIRIDFTQALLKKDYDKTEAISFNVGSLF